MNVWRGPDDTGQIQRPRSIRLRVSRWRDPRLLIGLLLVGVAAVGGARVVAASDNTVSFWALSTSVRAGEPVREQQLTISRVQLSGVTADAYVEADDEWPSDLSELRWASDVGAGMLVARSTLAVAGEGVVGELPLMVESGSLPADLGRGDRVDVWVAPDSPTDEGSAVRVLTSVRVLSDNDDSSAWGGSPARTVLVDVGEAEIDGDLVAAVGAGRITLIRVA